MQPLCLMPRSHVCTLFAHLLFGPHILVVAPLYWVFNHLVRHSCSHVCMIIRPLLSGPYVLIVCPLVLGLSLFAFHLLSRRLTSTPVHARATTQHLTHTHVTLLVIWYIFVVVFTFQPPPPHPHLIGCCSRLVLEYLFHLHFIVPAYFLVSPLWLPVR